MGCLLCHKEKTIKMWQEWPCHENKDSMWYQTWHVSPSNNLRLNLHQAGFSPVTVDQK